MRSAARPTLTECMGRCRSTSMWYGVRRCELERGIALYAAREVEHVASSDKGLRKERDMPVNLLAPVFCDNLKFNAT